MPWMRRSTLDEDVEVHERHLNPSALSPVTEEDGQIEGVDGAVLIKVSRKERRRQLIKPPGAEQLRQIGCIDVAIAVQIGGTLAAESGTIEREGFSGNAGGVGGWGRSKPTDRDYGRRMPSRPLIYERSTGSLTPRPSGLVLSSPFKPQQHLETRGFAAGGRVD